MHFSQLTDIHTHHRNRSSALLSVEAHEVLSADGISWPQTPFSLSLHPWHLTPESVSQFQSLLLEAKDNPLLLGIGECGLDGKCETPLPLQIEAFLASLSAAKELRLPVIIHCVGLWAEMQQCVRQVWGNGGALEALSSGCPLIVHGFRKGPELCRQLVDAGFCISLGKYYNEACLGVIPADRLFHETDNN